MIRYLLVLQFPFLFLTALFVACGVFWLRPEVAFYHLGGLLTLVALHQVLRSARGEVFKTGAAIPILLAGALLAAWIYRPLHLGSWDEGSVTLALKLSALGVTSLLAGRLGAERAGGRYSLAASLALVGLLWIPSVSHPLMPLLLVGLVQAAAIAVVSGRSSEPRLPLDDAKVVRRTALARYAVLLLAMTLSATIWDYMQDTRWAIQLAAAFLAAALGALVGAARPRRALAAGVVLASVSVVYMSVAPGLALHPVHAIATGLALGSVLAFLDRAGGATFILGASFPWVLGLMAGMAFARQLPYGQWRIVFLVPLMVLLLWPRSLAHTREEPIQA